MKCLVGSRAIKHWFPDFREPKDYDYITTGTERSSKDIEYHPVSCSGHEWIIKQGPIASPETMLTLKMSHSFWDVHWDKTMSDIRFLQEKNIGPNWTLFDQLYSYWTFVHGHKKAKLNVSNEEFFTELVERQHPHDDLHKMMAFYDEPLYKRIKRDQSKAAVDYDLFLLLDHEDKIKLCQEELYVVALERYVIPKQYRYGTYKAYIFAAKQLITSMTKGWFPRFIVENWKYLYKPHHDYIGKYHAQSK